MLNTHALSTLILVPKLMALLFHSLLKPESAPYAFLILRLISLLQSLSHVMRLPCKILKLYMIIWYKLLKCISGGTESPIQTLMSFSSILLIFYIMLQRINVQHFRTFPLSGAHDRYHGLLLQYILIIINTWLQCWLINLLKSLPLLLNTINKDTFTILGYLWNGVSLCLRQRCTLLLFDCDKPVYIITNTQQWPILFCIHIHIRSWSVGHDVSVSVSIGIGVTDWLTDWMGCLLMTSRLFAAFSAWKSG